MGIGKNHAKKISFALFFFMILFFFGGCLRKVGEPLDINNLQGKTIGCMLAYSSDYILTNDYDGIEVRRFDTYTDMMMALTFHQLDAVAMEMDESYVFCRLQPEFAIYGLFKEDEPFCYYMNPDTPELNETFNAFIREFRETEEYRDIRRRVEASAFEPYVSKAIDNPGTEGKTLTVSVFDGWEPVSYLDFETDEWEGSDIELITHFANAIGAKVEFEPIGSYTQAVVELSRGKVDIMVCPDSIRYKEDLEKANNVTMSEWVWEKDIVIMVNSADYEDYFAAKGEN
ncbi:MAG TPA: transporter substrate-binding domain-containing protein [Thermotogota bacterium]|nr:transporter substrate-binding domain-containing protein [Thermotogota bacterium]